MSNITPKGEYKNFGFDPSKVIIKKEAWKFGSNIPLIVQKEDGQYDDYLPAYEAQADKYETYGCTVWGGQNQAEGTIKFLFGFEPNYYEGYNYNLANITPPGADPDVVYETFRKQGFIDQRPMPSTLEEFCKPRPVTDDLLVEGEFWLDEFEFNHEWIIPSNPNKMKELIVATLPYSIVGLSVTSWFKDTDGLYVDMGMPNSHWCICYGYRKTEDGKIILKIFDSYDHSKKELHPDHFVAFAKRIQIKKKTKPTYDTTSIGSVLLKWLSQLFAKLKFV